MAISDEVYEYSCGIFCLRLEFSRKKAVDENNF